MSANILAMQPLFERFAKGYGNLDIQVHDCQPSASWQELSKLNLLKLQQKMWDNSATITPFSFCF